MSNKTDNRKFCCEHFEHDYKTYNNHPNVRVVRLVSEKFMSFDKEIKLPFRFPPYPIELWPKNRMTLFVMTTGYRLFEFPNCSRKDNTLYKRIFYCPYCGKSLHKFYGPRIDEYVQEVEGDTFPLLSTRHEEYMKNDYAAQRMLGIYVFNRIYTEWYRYKDEEDKRLLRIYICLNLTYNSISCSEETVEICENVKLPEELITTEGEHTYWLQEERIEWMNESPITKIRYLYEKKTGFKRGICLFFKNHHIVYYNPGYEYGDREVMLCDADLEAIMTEYGYILDK